MNSNQSTPKATRAQAAYNWKCSGCSKLFTDAGYEKADRSVQGCPECGEADFELLPSPISAGQARADERRRAKLAAQAEAAWQNSRFTAAEARHIAAVGVTRG